MSDENGGTRNALVLVKGGRPSLYSEDVADEVCERLSEGETLVRICREEISGRQRVRGEFPAFATVMDWADPVSKTFRPDFMIRYASARLRQQQFLSEEIVEIADTPEVGYEEIVEHSAKNGVTHRRARKDMLAHRNLKIQTRKDYLKMINPQMWAERLQQALPQEADPATTTNRIIIEGGLPDNEPPPPVHDEPDPEPPKEP